MKARDTASRVGDKFAYRDDIYILAQTGLKGYCLISVIGGIRWNDPVDSIEEIQRTIDDHGFKKVSVQHEVINHFNKHDSVKSLRQKGFKVRVLHQRKPKDFNFELKNIDTDNKRAYFESEIRADEKGGKTRVEIRLPDGQEIAGEAVCHPEDHYNKKKGVTVAIENAYENHIA